MIFHIHGICIENYVANHLLDFLHTIWISHIHGGVTITKCTPSLFKKRKRKKSTPRSIHKYKRKNHEHPMKRPLWSDDYSCSQWPELYYVSFTAQHEARELVQLRMFSFLWLEHECRDIKCNQFFHHRV